VRTGGPSGRHSDPGPLVDPSGLLAGFIAALGRTFPAKIAFSFGKFRCYQVGLPCWFRAVASLAGSWEFGFACNQAIQAEVGSWHRAPCLPGCTTPIERGRVCTGDPIPKRECCRASLASEIASIRDQRCARWSQTPSTVVSSAGSRAATPTWISMGGGVSTGTAARGGGSKGERVPRTGWRFVHHLNRLSALAFLRPVRKVSLGAEFPAPFREPILRPGLPTPLPRAGRAEHTKTPSGPGIPASWRSERARFSFLGLGQAAKRLYLYGAERAKTTKKDSVWRSTGRAATSDALGGVVTFAPTGLVDCTPRPSPARGRSSNLSVSHQSSRTSEPTPVSAGSCGASVQLSEALRDGIRVR